MENMRSPENVRPRTDNDPRVIGEALFPFCSFLWDLSGFLSCDANRELSVNLASEKLTVLMDR